MNTEKKLHQTPENGQLSGKHQLTSDNSKKAIEDVLKAEEYADDWINNDIEKEKPHNRFVLGRVVNNVDGGGIALTDGTDEQEVKLTNFHGLEHKDEIKEVLKTIQPGWYVPFRKKTGKKSGVQFYEFDTNFLEIVDTIVTMNEPLKLSELNYKLKGHWYNGIIFGFDKSKNPIVYTAVHGLTVVENIRKDAHPKCGEMVDLCVNYNKNSKKTSIHCCYSAVGNKGVQEGGKGKGGVSQGALLTSHPVQVDSRFKKARDKIREEHRTEKLNEENKKRKKAMYDLLLQEYVDNHPADGGSKRDRLVAFEKSYLQYGLAKEDIKPGKKVWSKNGVPGVIIRPAKDENGRPIRVDGQVRVKYFWRDDTGKEGESIAMTRLENLWGEGGDVIEL